jgi:hypothetical protein
MGDAEGVRCAFALLVCPFEGDPVTGDGDVAGHLKGGGFEFKEFEGESFVGLGGDPAGDVVFVDGCRTDGRPPEEILVPEAKVGGQIIVLDVGPVGAFQGPRGLLVF